MRRRPKDVPLPTLPEVDGPRGKPPPPLASQLGDAIEPFLYSGGSSYFLLNPTLTFDPRPAGVQLLANVYIPAGRVGFIKTIRVAPFMPAVFSDPWLTSGIVGGVASWRDFGATMPSEQPATIPGGQNGVWTTPFGWEAYFTTDTELGATWTWSLRYVQGDIFKLRAQQQNIPDFSISNPASWYLVPDVAVPASAYPQGLPGNSPSPRWQAQRMQHLQGDPLNTHVMIPQDSTILLFAQWTQDILPIRGRSINGEIQYADGPDDAGEYPLLPSFGQLSGYMQALTSEATTDNARLGWGG